MEALAQARYETILANLHVIDTKHSSNFNQILKSLDFDKWLERIEALNASMHAA